MCSSGPLQTYYGEHKFPDADKLDKPTSKRIPPRGWGIFGSSSLVSSTSYLRIALSKMQNAECTWIISAVHYYPPIIRFPTSPLFYCEHEKHYI